jgi:hypothetical protein
VRQELHHVGFLIQWGAQLTNISAIVGMIDWQEFVMNMVNTHRIIGGVTELLLAFSKPLKIRDL